MEQNKRSTKEEINKDIENFKIHEENGSWIGYRICPSCSMEIKYMASKRCYLIRNLNKNKISNCLSCAKSNKNNPFYGKTHSVQSKKQVSINRIGKATGLNNSMANPEFKKRAKEGLKKAYDSGKLDFLKEIQRQGAIQKQADGRFKTAPISKAEIEIKKILETKFIIEPQFKIGSLRYDLFIKELNLFIEYNGDYWHCNPEIYKSDYFHTKKRITAQQIWDADKRKVKIAEEKGYKVFTIWEKEFKLNKNKTLEEILKYEQKN